MKDMKAGQCCVGMVRTNCYGLMNEQTKEMIFVDPGDSPETIVSMAEKMGGTPVAILLTHGHFDHIMAVEALKEKYQIPVYAGQEEADILEQTAFNLTDTLRHPLSIYPEVLLKDEETFTAAGFSIQAFHTPGHTKGSMCYYFPEEGVLASGDTLFCESVGRSDLPTGSSRQLVESVKRLLEILPEDTQVLPGHESATTIGHEKRYNPFV